MATLLNIESAFNNVKLGGVTGEMDTVVNKILRLLNSSFISRVIGKETLQGIVLIPYETLPFRLLKLYREKFRLKDEVHFLRLVFINLNARNSFWTFQPFDFYFRGKER